MEKITKKNEDDEVLICKKTMEKRRKMKTMKFQCAR
jgi:hypothetical protein